MAWVKLLKYSVQKLMCTAQYPVGWGKRKDFKQPIMVSNGNASIFKWYWHIITRSYIYDEFEFQIYAPLLTKFTTVNVCKISCWLLKSTASLLQIPKHLKIMDGVDILYFEIRAEEDAHCQVLASPQLLAQISSTLQKLNLPGDDPKVHSTYTTASPLPKHGRGQSGESPSGNWSYQLNQIISCGADPEVLMKNGNKRQLFSLRTLSPFLCERALRNSSFSWAFAWISSPPGIATPIGQTDLSSLEL